MLHGHARKRGSEGGNRRRPVAAPSKGGQMGTNNGEKSSFHLTRALGF